jgi:hypothetical protein
LAHGDWSPWGLAFSGDQSRQSGLPFPFPIHTQDSDAIAQIDAKIELKQDPMGAL